MEVIIKDHTQDLMARKNLAVAKALTRIGLEGEKNAVENVNKLVYSTPPKPSYPVRTGNLRAGISSQVRGNSVLIGGRVNYTRYVELGTRKMPARPFIVPAARDHLEEFKRIIEEELANAFI